MSCEQLADPDEQDFRLQQLLKAEKDSLVYLYDFGDGWEHIVELEKILPFNIEAGLPLCIDGGRTCPPEDVGGPPGYEMFQEAIADKSHPNHAEIMEWMIKQKFILILLESLL